MKRIVGLLSGAALVFTGAVSAANISTIDMAPGLAGANLKNLATERNTRYALMVSYPVGLTAQPTILDTATGNVGLKCGVDKQCRSPFNFRGKEEQQQLNDTLQQAASDYVTTVDPAAEQPEVYFGDIYTTVLWRTGSEQCLTLYSLTLDHEWESCEKIGKNSVALRGATAANIDAAIADWGASQIMLLNQGRVVEAALVDIKNSRLITACGDGTCKTPLNPTATPAVKVRQGSGTAPVQILAEDSYTLLATSPNPPAPSGVASGKPSATAVSRTVKLAGKNTYAVRSICITTYSRASGKQYEECFDL